MGSLDRLLAERKDLGWIDPNDIEALEIRARVYQCLSLLCPQDMVGVAKRRVGGRFDGGYVIADILTPDQAVLSIGVGPDVSFDLQLAREGHRVTMCDHTVSALPASHPNFTWHAIGVAADSNPSERLEPLARLMALLPQTSRDHVLKMDVEGAEWPVLAASAPNVLAQFCQICVEVHDLHRIGEPAFHRTATAALANLTREFALVHVHANNGSPVRTVGGFACPEVLELTLVRRDLAKLAPSQTWYPTAFDGANMPSSGDHLLWFYPFAPGSHMAALPEQKLLPPDMIGAYFAAANSDDPNAMADLLDR